VQPDPREGQAGRQHPPGAGPAWRRRTDGERRWPVAVAVLVAIALQLVLPARLGLRPKYLIPGLEAALLVALVVANPGRFTDRNRLLRLGGLALLVLVIAANTVSAGLLINDLLRSRGPVTDQGPGKVALWGVSRGDTPVRV